MAFHADVSMSRPQLAISAFTTSEDEMSRPQAAISAFTASEDETGGRSARHSGDCVSASEVHEVGLVPGKKKRKRGPKFKSLTVENLRRRVNKRIKMQGNVVPRGRPRQDDNKRYVRKRALADEKVLVNNAWKSKNEDQLREASDTLWGKRNMPRISQLRNHEIVQANILALQADPKTKGKRIGHAATVGMSVHKAAQYLRSSRRSVKIARAGYCKSDYVGAKRTNLKGSAVSVEEKKLCVDFFSDEVTSVASGTGKSGLHRMTMRVNEAMCKWYARYPQLCRDFQEKHPACDWGPSNKTRFAEQVREAVAASKVIGFDDTVEYDERFKIGKEKYQRKLDAARASRAKESKYAPVWRKNALVNLTPQTTMDKHDRIKPVGLRQFFRIIDEANIRWTDKTYIHPCKLCEEGPSRLAARDAVVAQMATLTELIAALPDGGEKTSARKKRKDLASGMERRQEGIRKYDMHVRQLEESRPRLDQIEKDLVPGQVLVFRDFVNQYNHRGKKINDLVLVLLWVEKPHGAIRVKVVHNFCADTDTQSCDTHFMQDVYRFHLGKADAHHSGLFAQFDEIIVAGDHGSHFSSVETIYFESLIKEMYNKRVHVVSLCSYHAWNRCDGAGSKAKEAFYSWYMKNQGPEDSPEAADIVNELDSNSMAYKFKQIERAPTNVHLVQKKRKGTHKIPKMKEQCEILFDFPDPNDTEWLEKFSLRRGEGETEKQLRQEPPLNRQQKRAKEHGIILCREIPTDEHRFVLVDLCLWSTMCFQCSQVDLHPVRHDNIEDCPLNAPVTLGANEEAVPDPERITDINQGGGQREAAKKVNEGGRGARR